MPDTRTERLEARRVYANRWVELYDDRVRLPDGAEGTYCRLRYRENPVGVVIVPRRADGSLLLLRVHRYAVEAVSLEFPRGSAEPGEPAATAAARELREETGLAPDRLRTLGEVWPDGAILETRAALLLAEVDDTAAAASDPREAIQQCVWMTMEQLARAVREGQVCDGFTLAAVAHLLLLRAAGGESRS